MKRLLLALLVTGCGASYASEYDLYIDKSFTAEQQELILSASGRWSGATDGGVTFNPHIGVDVPTTKHQVFVMPLADKDVHAYCTDPTAAGCTVRQANLDVGFVRLTGLDDNERLFRMTAQHELGHAMGLNHDSKGTVMAPDLGIASDTITARDVAQFNMVRK